MPVSVVVTHAATYMRNSVGLGHILKSFQRSLHKQEPKLCETRLSTSVFCHDAVQSGLKSAKQITH